MRTVLIYDKDKDYVKKLTRVLLQKKLTPFSICSFSDFKKMSAYIESTTVDILLSGESCFSESVEKTPAKLKLILSDGSNNPLCKNLSSISKYSSVPGIADFLILHMPKFSGDDYKKEAKLIGIYSPVKRCGKTLFSMALAMCIARSSPCALLSLECNSGMSEILSRSFNKTFSDVIYCERHGAGDLLSCVSECSLRIGDATFIPPVRIPSDLYDTGRDSVLPILNALRSSGLYDVLVLDMAEFTGGDDELLRACDIVYVPTKDDFISKAKISEFSSALSGNNSPLPENVKMIKLPLPKNLFDIYSLPLTELGTAAEDLIIKDKLIHD